MNQTFELGNIAPDVLDVLLAHGWRHFGRRFYRYNFAYMEGQLQRIIALRTDLSTFKLSKSQRRTMRRNADLQVSIEPATVDDERRALFEKHKVRFDEYVPEHIHQFISEKPATIPVPCVEMTIRNNNGALIATSYLDIGVKAVSSVYAMFDPAETTRALGIYTMLLEIEYAQSLDYEYYYSGYATTGSSRYDYKKRFHGLSFYDFATTWRSFPRQT